MSRYPRPRSGGGRRRSRVTSPPLHTFFSGCGRLSLHASYTRIVGLLRLRLIAIMVVLVIACGSNPWFAGKFAQAFDYVLETSDSVALGIADTIKHGGASLFCLSCLGSEARSVVRGAEDALGNTSGYKSLEHYASSTPNGRPCKETPPQASAGSAKTGQSPKHAAGAADRTCR